MASTNNWETILNSKNAQISEIYCAEFRTWWEDMTRPVGLRCPANPYPWSFYYGHSELQRLYSEALALVCENGTVSQVIDQLVWLRANCPEHGRDLYFSRQVIGCSGLTPEHKTKVALSLVTGLFKGSFYYDIIADRDNGNLNEITEMLTVRAAELNLPAVMLVSAVRFMCFRERYELRFSEMASSPWVVQADVLMKKAPGLDANVLADELSLIKFPSTHTSSSSDVVAENTPGVAPAPPITV